MGGIIKKISSGTNERGAVLITGLLLVLVLSILSLAAMISTATDSLSLITLRWLELFS